MLDSKSDDDVPVVAVAVVAADAPLANASIEYEYEEIPKLLFVDMQQEDDEKVAASLAKLADLLDTSNANWKVNADNAFSSGAIAIVSVLMRKWHCNRSIQIHGCNVLVWLTGLTSSREQLTNDEGAPVGFSKKDEGAPTAICRRKYHNKYHNCQLQCNSTYQCPSCQRFQTSYEDARARAVSIVKSGGIETMMAAMKSFPDDDDIQGKGSEAIGNVFYCDNAIHCDNSNIDKAMARFVYKLNGIELVVSLMKKFQNNASVQGNGCHVLLQLSKKQVLRDALKKGGALGAVGEAAGKHDGNGVQSAAASFFQNMFGAN